MNKVIHLDIKLDADKLQNDALKIIKNVRPDWNLEEIQFKKFAEGIVNTLVGCYVSTDPDDMVLVKIFGDNSDLYIDRETELNTCVLLHHHGYGSKVYATFENGMAYGFVPGKQMDIDENEDPALYPLVARMMAKLHKLSFDDSIPKEPVIFTKLWKVLNSAPDRYTDPAIQDKCVRDYPPDFKNYVKQELQRLEIVLKNVDSPVVLCHNDLLAGNILICGDDVRFIDFEFSGYNYQAFDIANYFNEFLGIRGHNDSRYPSKKFQLEWIKYYLQEYKKVESVSDHELNAVYANVRKFTPLSHLAVVIYSLIQAELSKIEFDYLKLGLARLEEYRKTKDNVNDTN